jgi:hypothetical protein
MGERGRILALGRRRYQKFGGWGRILSLPVAESLRGPRMRVRRGRRGRSAPEYNRRKEAKMHEYSGCVHSNARPSLLVAVG